MPPLINTPHRRSLSALLIGAISVFAYAPFGYFPLIWLSLGGLFALLDKAASARQSARQGAYIGAAFGLGLFLAGVSWIYVSLSVFGGMPMPLAGLATLLFCLMLAAYPALVGALFVRLAPATWPPRIGLFAALWVLTEWLRGWLFTGFPWLAVGYAQTPPSPLAGFAPIFGVYGVSLCCALLGALLYQSIKRPWSALPMAGLLLATGAALSNLSWTEAQGQALSVALLQGNISQHVKWQPEHFVESLHTYRQLAQDHPAQLTVLPETALPALLEQVPLAYLDELKRLAARQQGALLFGIPIAEAGRYSNSAVSLSDLPPQRYDKSHLVPFGEFIPPGFAWFLDLVHIPMSDFTPGARQQPTMNLLGQKLALNICYEDAFGEEIIHALPSATLLVNLSNVAWFGDSLAPTQHLQIAQMRALESGRMMLRATNTGMTAIIGADGRVQDALPPFTRAALLGEVRAYVGTTPFVRWGNWPAITLALLLVFLASKRSKKSSAKRAA
jgi:apolipoprotein N-acyltransferase